MKKCTVSVYPVYSGCQAMTPDNGLGGTMSVKLTIQVRIGKWRLALSIGR